jgi:hypothetical protein
VDTADRAESAPPGDPVTDTVQESPTSNDDASEPTTIDDGAAGPTADDDPVPASSEDSEKSDDASHHAQTAVASVQVKTTSSGDDHSNDQSNEHSNDQSNDHSDDDNVCPNLDTGHLSANDQTTWLVEASEGKLLIAEICVKAGSANQGDGPETFPAEYPVTSVWISNSTGKDISHYSVRYVGENAKFVPEKLRFTFLQPCEPSDGSTPEQAEWRTRNINDASVAFKVRQAGAGYIYDGIADPGDTGGPGHARRSGHTRRPVCPANPRHS